LLVELRRWDDLLGMLDLLRGRASAPLRAELGGYADYLEGRAHHARGEIEPASACFRKAAQRTFPWPGLGLSAGVALLRLDYCDLAQAVLLPLESDLANDQRYWQALFEAALVRKRDGVELYKAAANAYRLAPDETLSRNNYAVALLINRWQPAEAVRLTRDLLTQSSFPTQARLNHAFALTLNRRFAEAEAMLERLKPDALDDVNRTVYHLIAFELQVRRGQFAQARRDAARVRSAHLFPNQVEWLQRAVSRLPEG
jgi:Flp pilus assembly protein TadD